MEMVIKFNAMQLPASICEAGLVCQMLSLQHCSTDRPTNLQPELCTAPHSHKSPETHPGTGSGSGSGFGAGAGGGPPYDPRGGGAPGPLPPNEMPKSVKQMPCRSTRPAPHGSVPSAVHTCRPLVPHFRHVVLCTHVSVGSPQVSSGQHCWKFPPQPLPFTPALTSKLMRWRWNSWLRPESPPCWSRGRAPVATGSPASTPGARDCSSTHATAATFAVVFLRTRRGCEGVCVARAESERRVARGCWRVLLCAIVAEGDCSTWSQLRQQAQETGKHHHSIWLELMQVQMQS